MLVYSMTIWYIMWSFGIFRGHLVYFVIIWYILWSFGIFCGHLVYIFPFWYVAANPGCQAHGLYVNVCTQVHRFLC
jgi:hypothetical protein